MQRAVMTLPSLHEKQLEIKGSSSRFRIITAGRRFGKDCYLQDRLINEALKGKPVAFFAPTYRMLLENWRTLRNTLAPITARANDSEHRIDLVTGNPIEMWSLDNPDSARGRKYAYVAINEAAMVKNLGDAWAMVIRPTLADYRGSADFGSTPKGLNDFYSLWQRAGDDPDWRRFHYRTDDNPHIPADEIAAMRASLPERVVKQEIDAEFVEDGSYFQNVEQAAVIQAPDMPENHAGHYLVMGCDWAMSQDYSVFVIGCRDCNCVVDWWRGNQIDYTYQRERLVTLAERWGVQGVLPERNSIGQPNIELLRDRVTVMLGPDDNPGFNTSATTKPALIQGLASALEHDGFRVPADAADELRIYEVETMASGHPKFSAPDGQHDDFVIALALLWRAMTSAKVQIWV